MRQFVKLLWASPRWTVALTAAVAAALAYWAGMAVPGPAGDYPYYAPLGAVVAMSSTLFGSARRSVQSIVSIWLGSAIALLAASFFPSDPLSVAAVVGVGMLVAGWHRLGEMGSWVPSAAVFVLIIGSTNPVGFVGAYGGLTLLGAAIGVGMTALFPQLPMQPADRSLDEVRQVLIDQLEELAQALQQDTPPTASQWDDRRLQTGPALWRMRAAMRHVTEAARGNRRRANHRGRLERQIQQAEILERVSFLIEDLSRVLSEDERAENDSVGLGKELRPDASEALRALAALLQSGDGRTVDEDLQTKAEHCLSRLVDQIGRVRATSSDDGLFTAGSIVTSIRRCLAMPRPHE